MLWGCVFPTAFLICQGDSTGENGLKVGPAVVRDFDLDCRVAIDKNAGGVAEENALNPLR